MSGNKIIAIIIVVLIHVAIGYALVSGLAYKAAQKLVERVTTVDIEEPPPPEEEPPPPPPVDAPPPPPVAPPPPINVNPNPPPVQVVDTPPPPMPVFTQAARPAPPPPPPPPAPPPPPSQARGATPQNQNSWASRIQENYPARAIRDEIEGRVGVRVTIGANGRVTACTVSNSSGSSVLDQAACEGMERYARYNPALDDAGNPTTGQASTTIVYQLSR